MMVNFEDKRTTSNIIIRASRQLFRFLAWVSGGLLDVRYDERTTTIGGTVYQGSKFYSKSFDAQSREMAHEIEHIRQWDTWGPIYYLSYIINLPCLVIIALGIVFAWGWLLIAALAVVACMLPAGLSMRAYWEYKAFKTGYLFGMEIQGYKYDGITAQHATRLICGAPYLWAGWLVTPLVRRAWRRVFGVE